MFAQYHVKMNLSWSRNWVKYLQLSSNFSHCIEASIILSLSFSVLDFYKNQESLIQSGHFKTDFGLVPHIEVTKLAVFVETQTYYNLVETKQTMKWINWIVTSLFSLWNRCQAESRTYVIKRARWDDGIDSFLDFRTLKSLILLTRDI